MQDFDLLNCSLQMDDYLNNLSENFNSSGINSASEVRAVGIGTATGILIAALIDVILSIEYNKSGTSTSVSDNLVKIFNEKTVPRIIALTILVLVLPLITFLLLLALVYKVVCSVAIKRKDKHFVGFLDSFDVFWSLENDSSKSVINVLGIIESDSPDAIANSIKEKLRNILPNDGTRKIFYRRNEEFGFYYWRRHSFVDLDQYVELVELPDNSKGSTDDLETLMSDLQNRSLPYEDEGLFKILITKQRVCSNEKKRGEYGIIFRIHHSIGDGVALIEFLCQTLADQSENGPINMFSMPENKPDSPTDLLDMMQKLCEIPICFIDGIVRKPDSNSLHGSSLLGKKVFKWTKSDENLLLMVKEIKNNVDRLNFSDVLITSLSNGLRNFFSQRMGPIPDDIAVVLPIRFPKSSADQQPMAFGRSFGEDIEAKLMNDFSVTILDVPVKGQVKIEDVATRCNKLRRSSDPLTNYYFLKLVSSVLPCWALQPLLNSSQATMIFSNMPGPQPLDICGGNALKSMVFFVPHKGNTGVGVTALCYGGVLRFAAMADAALISSSEELGIILNGMVEEIHRLHKLYVLK